MKIRNHPNFNKNFTKRIKSDTKLLKKFKERILVFETNKSNPLLADHQLSGKRKDFRSFSITGDVRVIYLEVNKEEVLFIDIGSHNQVY